MGHPERHRFENTMGQPASVCGVTPDENVARAQPFLRQGKQTAALRRPEAERRRACLPATAGKR